MSLISGLYRRFRHLIHEFAMFGIVGGVGFLVTEGVFNLMISSHQATFTANAVSTLVAAAVTFLGNRYWTFRHRGRSGMWREAAVFFVLNLIGIVIQQACLELAKHELGRNDKLTLNAAFLVGVGLATLFRFWSYRKFVWLAQPGVPGGRPGAAPVPPLGPLPGGYEAREPALVPSDVILPPPAPGHPGPSSNGQGRVRAGGRHARPR